MAVVLVRNLPGFAGDPEREIASRIAAGRHDSFFSVAPTKRKVRWLRREYLAASPGRVAGPFSIFTLGTLAEALFDALLPPRIRLSDRMRAAVVQEAIRTCATELEYFSLRGPQRRLPRGTLSRIANVLNRLKSTGVYLSRIREEIGEGGPGERLKLRDIALIYEAYERLLAEGGYIDTPGYVESVNLEWTRPGSEERFRARHPAVDLVAVSGFDEFSDPELTMLGYLSGTPGLGTVVTFDYHPDNDDLFGHLEENYRKLLEMGFTAAGSPARGATPFRSHIARRLFAPPEARGGAPFDATALIGVCAAPDRAREAELVVNIVKRELADDPSLRPDEVCVCSPRPELYSTLFREAFERAGVAANVTDRFLLEGSAAVTGVVAVLLVAQNNFRIEDIARSGTNPFLSIPTGGGAFDAPNLLRMAGDLRTVSGRKRWIERIEARSRSLAREAGGERPGRRNAAEADRLKRARRDIDALDRLAAAFREPLTPVGFRDAVIRLTETLGVAASIAAAGAHTGAGGPGLADVEREARGFAEFLGFLDEFPAIVSIESPANEAHPLSWYLERFRPLLAAARYNVKQRHGEGVLVTSIDEMRGLSFRLMVVAGMVGGEFPAAYEPEVFLTPKSRERRERYHLHGQRYLFHQALSASSGRIVLTWPRRDGDVELNRSGFLERLSEAATVARFEEAEAHPAASLITCPDELLEAAVGRAATAPEDGHGAGPVPAHIGVAIAAERARRRDEGEDDYRGFIDPARLPEKERARLASWRTGTYSVTQLETYGDCPFKFFAERVLGLQALDEPEEGVTPKEMGRILHEVLYDFYSDRRARGLAPIPGLDDEAFAEAVAGLKAIAGRRFDEAHVDDVFWEIGREAVLGGPGGAGVLEEMLSAERRSSVSAAPSWFEVRFGKAGADVQHSDPVLFSDEPVPAGPIFLQGKIDRIDADGDAFAVVDYKTGSTVPGKRAVDEGASLQLPLYLHCAEHLLSEKLGRAMTGGAGIYYTLGTEFRAVPRIGDAGMKGRLIDTASKTKIDAGPEDLRKRVAAAVAEAADRADRISRGLFPVQPREPSVCRRCSFNRTCRVRMRVAPDPAAGDDDGRDDDQPQRDS